MYKLMVKEIITISPSKSLLILTNVYSFVVITGLKLRVHTSIFFSYFSTETYVVCTQKNCLDETVLLSTQTYAENYR